MENFRKLGICEPVLKSLQEHKFENPSEIQEKAIPLILHGEDVIADSATGTGKTLVFGSGIIHNTEKGRGIQSLVLTPTRELAEQISCALKSFSKYKQFNISAIYGGISINPQFDELERAEIVIGTPGRILDHINRGTIDLGSVKILVLDEADRMLDMGFINDVEKIIHQCPTERQTLLFSATISEDIAHLSRKYMDNPVKVSVQSQVDPKKLTQIYYDVPDNQKFSLFVHLLKNEKSGLVMVFCNTQRNTDFVANNLRLNDIDALAIHGGFSQAKRKRTMEKFNANNFQVLVCTDVAARGLDIKGVSHIYNYDIPKEAKQYIHRIGRTARAGKEGKAINLLASRDYENYSNVLKYNDLKIPAVALPEFERAVIKTSFSQGRRFGGRERRGGRGNGRSSGGGRGGGFRRGRGDGRGRHSSDRTSGRRRFNSRANRR